MLAQSASYAHLRARFMRPDASRYLRPDATRWLRPDANRYLKPGTDPTQILPTRESKYNPNQPRVPAGNLGAGEWTLDGGVPRAPDTRLASSDKRPSLGRAAILGVLARAAERLMEVYRSENGLRDLFGRNEGTVAYTQIEGKDVFGSNSNSPTYTTADRREADKMRDDLIQSYPEEMNTESIGQKPNDAIYHAEANAMIRAARESGGSLAGKDITVFVDRQMCYSCERILPLIGERLGNPRVTFVGPSGIARTMHNGRWSE